MKLEILHTIIEDKPGSIYILCNIKSFEIAHVNTNTLLNLRNELVGECIKNEEFLRNQKPEINVC